LTVKTLSSQGVFKELVCEKLPNLSIHLGKHKV
jgi:hypothetical protein